jgi:hypothetical protein
MRLVQHSRLLVVLTVLPALALPASAAEVDKYLPNDTESVQTINVRQILDSAIVKKYFLEKMEQGLKSSDEVQKVLKELNFDPLKDIHSYTQTNGGGDKIENALYIVHGKFDAEKLQAKAGKIAKDMPNLVKITEVGDNKLYEVVLPFPLPPPLGSIYAAVVDEKTLVGSLSKDYILEVFDKKAGKKKTTLRKEVANLIEKVDGKQSFWIAAFRAAFLKGPIKDQKEIAAFLEKTDHMSGGITVTDEIKAGFTLVASDADAAKDITKLIEKAMADLKEKGGDSLVQKTLLEILGGIKVGNKGEVVTVTGQVPKKDVEKYLEAFK